MGEFVDRCGIGGAAVFKVLLSVLVAVLLTVAMRTAVLAGQYALMRLYDWLQERAEHRAAARRRHGELVVALGAVDSDVDGAVSPLEPALLAELRAAGLLPPGVRCG